MGNTLLAITTANQWDYTEACMLSLKESLPEGCDLIIVDDASNDGTPQHCEKMGVRCISKKKPLGLTDSWNTAYHIYKEEGYDNLILSNNDILVPIGALENLINALDSHLIAGPLSTEKGIGHQPQQFVGHHHQLKTDDSIPDNYQLIQNELPENTEVVDLDRLNGFCFAMGPGIRKYELPGGNLFDPTNINVGNEDELCDRVVEPKGVVLNSFIFHFKGVSFSQSIHEQDIETNVYRNLTWNEAEELSDSPAKLFLHKLKRKLNKGK